MLWKRRAVMSKDGPAADVGAHRDVSVLGHGRESPNGKAVTEQVDMVYGLNSPSARTQPHVGREQGSSQSAFYGRSQYDVAEIVVLRVEVGARDLGPGFLIPNSSIKEVQADTVRPVLAAHLGVKVIKGASIVLVDIPVLDKDSLRGGCKLCLETLCDALRIELGVKHIDEKIVIFNGSKLDPIVGHQCDCSLSIASPERRYFTGRRRDHELARQL